ncbi:MAG: 50S ribosomal protein L9 [Bacteroidota bacterium]
MKLILKEEVPNLGSAGDLVDVKAGFGRNFLLPQGKAVLATDGALRQIEQLKVDAKRKADQTIAEAKELANRLQSTSISIPASTGEEDKIHGTVTTMQIANALAEEGIEVDRRKITLDQDIKTLGEYTATIELVGEFKPKVTFQVVKES